MAIEFSNFQCRQSLEYLEPVDPPEPPPPPPPQADAPPAPASAPTNLLLSLPNAPLAPDFVAVGERPGASVLSELPQTAFQAAPSAAAAANGSPPAPATAYAGEPAVSASWLAERETALTVVRSDVEARRAQAQASAGSGPGWVDAQMVTDESGRLVSASGGATVFVADPGAVPQLIGWDEGGPVYAGVMGRYLEFSEEAFGAHYRAQAQTETDTPLQTLARLYDTDAPDLLARHPEIWGIATTDHALNAGPAPAGQAMGDAGQLAMLDLYMADPQVAELIQRYGGSVAPATSGIALEQVRIHGQARYEQMTRLANAMQAVRSDYSSAMQQAATANGGPGWVEQPRMVTISDEGGATRTEPMVTRDESGVATTVTERFFDPDRFTAWYMQQPGAANQAFADFYGQSHTQWATDESGARMAASISFDNPNWQLNGLGGPMRHTELVSLDPNHAPRLNNDGAVGFDFDAGWATHSSNIHQKHDWFETVVQVAMVAAVAYISAGTLGPAAAGAAGMTTTTAAGATVLTAGGMVVSAAVVGAATSFVSGAMNGNLSLKGVLTGALSGALTAGLANGLSSVTGPLTGAGAIAGRMTVQGGVQALLGGSFKDGAIAGFASGLADLAGQNMTAGIDKAVDARTMNAGEAFAARSLARVFTSAVRTLGSPGDPQYAFASDLVGSVVNAGLDSTQPLPGAAFAGTAFDDDGNLMPGVVDSNAPAAQQYQQLQAALLAQGLSPDMAQSLAFTGLVTAGADARTVRGYFVPEEAHDTALSEVLAERASLSAPAPDAAEPEVEPIAASGDENGPVIQMPAVVVTGRRITLADDLADRIGGTLGDLYQQGKELATRGLDLAAQGLSVLDIPALQDFQQRTRDYLNAKAEAGGLSEAEIIMFGGLYALNEALMPTNVLDFAAGAGKGITAAAAVIRRAGKSTNWPGWYGPRAVQCRRQPKLVRPKSAPARKLKGWSSSAPATARAATGTPRSTVSSNPMQPICSTTATPTSPMAQGVSFVPTVCSTSAVPTAIPGSRRQQDMSAARATMAAT